jgi:hypothetical protein
MSRRAAAFAIVACLFCSAATLTATVATAADPAPSPQARELRASGDLIPYTPPQELLNAYFTASENAPKAVYGPVAAYAKTRACKTAWLIEKGELARVERLKGLKDGPPFEFSVTLEEDCPGKVTHAVFVTAPGSAPEAWFAWRRQFHGSKAQGYYGAAEAELKGAAAAGLAPNAELRFLSVNGELVTTNLEQVLRTEGRLAPVFDLQKGERTSR